MREKKIEVKGTMYSVEFADNLFSHALGMRGRKDGKMMFEFPFEKRWTLDMALVLSDLYLYFFDSERKLVEAGRASKWRLDPRSWNIYKPQEPAKYLLESTEPLGLTKGERFNFE